METDPQQQVGLHVLNRTALVSPSGQRIAGLCHVELCAGAQDAISLLVPSETQLPLYTDFK